MTTNTGIQQSVFPGPSQPVHITNQQIPIVIGGVPGTSYQNLAHGQSAVPNGSAQQMAPARSFKRSLLLKNIDGSIIIYIGGASVASNNGMPLLPGQSVQMFSIGAIYARAASGSPLLAWTDEYD